VGNSEGRSIFCGAAEYVPSFYMGIFFIGCPKK